jgi:hypothetical protein
VALLVAVAALSLLVALFAPTLNLTDESVATVRRDAVVMVPSCLLLLFVILYGQGSSCPACGKWWARTEGATESLGREEFDKGGVSWVRARRQTTYACKHCHHTWTATYTDEYKGSLRPRRNSAGG